MNVPFFDIRSQFSSLKKEIMTDIEKIFESCSFVGGSYVQEFEKEIAEYLGVKHAVGCGSGTEALILALKACGVKEGDEVITTSFSFFATPEAIAAVGGVPVFVDIRANDFLIDYELIEESITEKTKVILPVQLFGACCDMNKISDIAKRHGLRVVEDCAQAIGSEYEGKKAGSLADIGCFSFYPTKNLGGCGDGGLCTTNDEDLYTVLMALHEHGAGKNGFSASKILGFDFEEQESNEAAQILYDPFKYYNYLIGTNSRLDAIQAAVLSIKLKRLDRYNELRSKIAYEYLTRLTDKVKLPRYQNNIIPVWHQFVIRTDKKYELCSFLRDKGVGSGTFYPVPLHKQKAFEIYPETANKGYSLSVSEKAANETVCLPCYPEMSKEEIDYVIDAVNSYFEED